MNQQNSIGSTDNLSATLWITNPQNHFIGNVAAGGEHNGKTEGIKLAYGKCMMC